MGLNAVEDLDYGIVLAVGFFPGLKFDVIPLLRPKGVWLLSLRFFRLCPKNFFLFFVVAGIYKILNEYAL